MAFPKNNLDWSRLQGLNTEYAYGSDFTRREMHGVSPRNVKPKKLKRDLRKIKRANFSCIFYKENRKLNIKCKSIT